MGISTKIRICKTSSKDKFIMFAVNLWEKNNQERERWDVV